MEAAIRESSFGRKISDDSIKIIITYLTHLYWWNVVTDPDIQESSDWRHIVRDGKHRGLSAAIWSSKRPVSLYLDYHGGTRYILNFSRSMRVYFIWKNIIKHHLDELLWFIGNEYDVNSFMERLLPTDSEIFPLRYDRLIRQVSNSTGTRIEMWRINFRDRSTVFQGDKIYGLDMLKSKFLTHETYSELEHYPDINEEWRHDMFKWMKDYRFL